MAELAVINHHNNTCKTEDKVTGSEGAKTVDLGYAYCFKFRGYSATRYSFIKKEAKLKAAIEITNWMKEYPVVETKKSIFEEVVIEQLPRFEGLTISHCVHSNKLTISLNGQSVDCFSRKTLGAQIWKTIIDGTLPAID